VLRAQTYTGKLYGKQDDLCIALQLAMIGCQKVHAPHTLQHTIHNRASLTRCVALVQFFQDPKYKSFRVDDYHTPLGLANNARPRGVV